MHLDVRDLKCKKKLNFIITLNAGDLTIFCRKFNIRGKLKFISGRLIESKRLFCKREEMKKTDYCGNFIIHEFHNFIEFSTSIKRCIERILVIICNVEPTSLPIMI